jgi:antitoxin VapB
MGRSSSESAFRRPYIRRGTHRSTRQLEEAIRHYIKINNAEGPAAFRADASVPIFRQRKDIVLRERPVNGAVIFDVLLRMPHEFMPDGQDDSTPQERESF